jgi:GDPmannose 4,6-dehydratase|tara:strand:+ start:2633 stop:3574 length:942 start_codon:yes stop_codon:yes gene_type:complete
MKNILIISTGILSAYLSKFLLSKKYKIYVTTSKERPNYKNFKKLKIDKKIIFNKLNIYDQKSIEKTIAKTNPSIIFYFAGQSSIAKSLLLREETLKSNYIGCKNFLEVLKKKNSSIKFIKANSGYIFSDKKKINFSNPKFSSNINPYILSQKKAYKIISRYRLKNVNSYNAILYNAESNLRDRNFLIKKICIYIKNNVYKKKKILVGNLKLIRDFGWAPELVEGIYYMSYLKPCDMIISSGKSYLLENMIKFIFEIKKLNYKNFITIDKNLFRKNEQLTVATDMKNTIKRLKIYNWKPKIYGKKLVKKIYNGL